MPSKTAQPASSAKPTTSAKLPVKTFSLGRDDLPLVAKLADQGHTFIFDRLAELKSEQSECPPHHGGRHLVTLGTATSTRVAPREVFRGAILAGASALVVAHNYPSGDPVPSATDEGAAKV